MLHLTIQLERRVGPDPELHDYLVGFDVPQPGIGRRVVKLAATGTVHAHYQVIADHPKAYNIRVRRMRSTSEWVDVEVKL